ALEGRPEDDRDLAEDLAGRPRADGAAEPVDHLGDFDLPREDYEKDALVPLVRRELAGPEAHVRGCLRHARELVTRHIGKETDRRELIGGDHASLYQAWARESTARRGAPRDASPRARIDTRGSFPQHRQRMPSVRLADRNIDVHYQVRGRGSPLL